MSTSNRAGLWFTITGSAVWAGIIAHYGFDHAPPALVLMASAMSLIGFIGLILDPKPNIENTK